MIQHAGRTDHLEPGICLHLLARGQAERTAAQGEAEILQSDLSELLMELLQWGCTKFGQLNWLNTSPAINLRMARWLLQMLGVLGGDRLSVHG